MTFEGFPGWSGKNSWPNNSDLRIYVPLGNSEWDAYLTPSALTPWAQCTAAQQTAYTNKYGAISAENPAPRSRRRTVGGAV